MQLFRKLRGELLERHLFDICSLLSYGLEDIASDGDKEAIARLYLKATEKAMQTTGFSAAVEHARHANRLVLSSSLLKGTDLHDDIVVSLIEAEYSSREYAQAIRHITEFLRSTENEYQQIRMYSWWVKCLLAAGQTEKAIRTGLDGLQSININVPWDAQEAARYSEALKAKIPSTVEAFEVQLTRASSTWKCLKGKYSC